MQIIEEREIPASTKAVCVGRKCDLCGVESRSHHQWAQRKFEVAETEVSCRTGQCYPEGGSGLAWEIDLCPACFLDRLVPWLQSQGAEIAERDWDC